MRLQDKVVIVTGSTTGIGRATAVRCVEEGAWVVIHGRDEERGKRVAASLGDRAALVIEDLTDPTAPQRIIDTALRTFGRLDAIVNNAAFVVRSNVYNTTVDLFDQVIATNVRAPLLLVQAGLKHLEASQGCVVNIGSFNGYGGEENLLAYSISKGALLTLSKNLADSLHRRHGIRVNHVNVGWVLTENEIRYKIKDGYPADWPQKLPKTVAPCGRLLSPEEMARMITFWLSDESRPVSGSVVDLEQFPFLGRIVPPEL
jgi:NAD(P)-dependent dehydrogenase (short-subunit alcohol dehydrogenase family)